MIGFIDIRNRRYADLRADSIKNGADFDNFKRWPYTCFKGRILAELASILVFLLQFTPIHANHITFFYALSGIIGALFLGSQNTQLILAGLIIFFLKNLPDWVDGFIARLKNQTSEEGKILDPWGALVNSHAFIIGFGIYVFNTSNQVMYLYILILIIFLRAIDLRNYTFIQFMNGIINNELKLKDQKNIESSNTEQLPLTSKIISTESNNIGFLKSISKFVFNFLDDRSRSVDFVCLIILLEVLNNQIYLSKYLMFGYLFKYLMIFFGGIYIVYYKKIPTKIHNSLFNQNENLK